jgi:hypothetical protein
VIIDSTGRLTRYRVHPFVQVDEEDESRLVPLKLLEQPELKSRMVERFDLILPP